MAEAEAETVNEFLVIDPKASAFRRELWLFLNAEYSPNGCRRYALKYEMFSIGLVLFLLIMDIVLSVEAAKDYLENIAFFGYIEYGAYAVFTTEYVLRMWSCMASAGLAELGPIFGRVNYTTTGLTLIDFIVLGAFYFEQYENMSDPSLSDSSGDGDDDDSASQLHGLRVLRLFRAFRAAKILKVDKGTNAVGVLLAVFQQASKPMMATAMLACMLIVIFATVMYYIENGVNENFSSIPMSMWWAVTAMTSVGYGDAYPVSPLGQVVGSIACIVGAGIIALPTGILSMGFQEECEKKATMEEAKKIEEEALEETRQLERLVKETDMLRAELVEVSKESHETMRCLRKMFPERAAAVLTAEEIAEINSLEEDELVDIDKKNRELVNIDLNYIRAKVQKQVSQLRRKARRGGFFGKNVTLAKKVA